MRKAPWPILRFIAAIFVATTLIAPTRLRAEPAPPPADEETPDGPYLNIPDVELVPIPAPPDARVFAPPDRPRAEAAKPRGSAKGRGGGSPAPPLSDEQRRAGALDSMFARLSSADSAEEARSIAGSIVRLWARSGSDTADLLFARAALAASHGDNRLALDLFDDIVALEPAWAEGFMGRANAKIAAGDFDGASGDFETALKLEPRRFDALAAIGALLERAGARKRALEAYRRALAINPQQDDWRTAEERLRLEVEDRDI